MAKENTWAWHCFHIGCTVWAQTEEAIESHCYAAHAIPKDAIRRKEHYGSKEEKALMQRQRDEDIENATRGFSKWLDSLGGADDFLYESGGL